MRVKPGMLGLVLGAASSMWLVPAAEATPMIKAKQTVKISDDIERVASRSAPAKGLAPIRALMRKPSHSLTARRVHKGRERASRPEPVAKHLGPIHGEIRKSDHRVHFAKKPIEPKKHYKRVVADLSKHHAHHDAKEVSKDHFRRKKVGGKDDKGPRVTYLGSIHKFRDHGEDHHKKFGRYYIGGGVYIDYRSEIDEDSSEHEVSEPATADTCPPGRACDVKLKWIRVPLKEEAPLK